MLWGVVYSHMLQTFTELLLPFFVMVRSSIICDPRNPTVSSSSALLLGIYITLCGDQPQVQHLSSSRHGSKTGYKVLS